LKITVIIPTFNRARFISAAVDSALKLGPDLLEEIIVIDDGSTDHTPTVVAAYGSQVNFLRKENGGKSSALNSVLSIIKGTYVYILDDDDILVADSLSQARDLLEANSDLDFVIGQIVEFQESRNELFPAQAKPAQLNVSRLHFDLLLGSFVLLNACLTRTRHFLAAGPLDKRLIRSQDYEFFLRLTRNARGRFLAAPMYWLRQHDGIRGSASVNVASHKVTDLWQRFDQYIGTEIRRSLDECYFCPPEARKLKNTERRRLSYLYRGLVMATKDLPDQALDDLRAASDLPPIQSLEGAVLERRLLISFARVPNFLRSLDDKQRRARFVELLRSDGLNDLAAVLLRALVWPMRNNVMQRQWKAAATLLLVIVSPPTRIVVRGLFRTSLESDYFWKSA